MGADIKVYLTAEECLRFKKFEDILFQEVNLDTLKRAQTEWIVLIEKALSGK
ncbi:hypothetical protein [Pseudalkalibacillus salsuginis]|uniref:hypothetical protein n=1 Tax=Pseudalkalibacillus salsuginis TaxID=2910972 RepID=UPI001F39E0D9|nr:hypothetical protein [Pseudalkalibacillus salsuginis]MCF6411654.1 hypothetical protein [Pseudalkalibacillus salsuginis]